MDASVITALAALMGATIGDLSCCFLESRKLVVTGL